MSLESKLRSGAPKPRRELHSTFTNETLAKALGTRPFGFTQLLTWLKTAPVAAALAILCTAGTAYAAFNWQQVQILFGGSAQSKTFDAQEYIFNFKSCDALGIPGGGVRYGVVKDAKVQQDEISNLIQARCEIAQAKKLYEQQEDWMKLSNPDAPENYIFTEAIVEVTDATVDRLSTRSPVDDPEGKISAFDRTDTITAATRVYEDGKRVDLSSVKKGDRIITVIFLSTTPNGDGSNRVLKQEAAGIIKVRSQVTDPKLFNKVFEIAPCVGNPETTCVDTPSPALRGMTFNKNEGEGGNFNRRKDVAIPRGGKNIPRAQGRITSVDGTGFTLRAFESQVEYRVNLPASDRKIELKTGDAISIWYVKKPGEDLKTINVEDFVNSGLIVTESGAAF